MFLLSALAFEFSTYGLESHRTVNQFKRNPAMTSRNLENTLRNSRGQFVVIGVVVFVAVGSISSSVLMFLGKF